MMRKILLSLGAILALLLIFRTDTHLRIITTDSAAAAGIYWQSASVPQHGDLVLACLALPAAQFGFDRNYLGAGLCATGAEPVAKRVGALPGDLLDIEAHWVAINGERFPNSATVTRDGAGRPLPHVPFGTRRVAPDRVWLFGFNNVRSWDARYWGELPFSSILGNLKPVTTW